MKDISLNRESFNLGETIWSDEAEENPPFHDFCKVYVHYCSRYAGDGYNDDNVPSECSLSVLF